MKARDTSQQADCVQREAHRRLGGAGRVDLAFEMSEVAREISIAGIRSRDPSLSPEQARERLLQRILGEDLWRAAYENVGS